MSGSDSPPYVGRSSPFLLVFLLLVSSLVPLFSTVQEVEANSNGRHIYTFSDGTSSAIALASPGSPARNVMVSLPKGAEVLDDMIFWSASFKGPKAVPGEYKVTLEKGNQRPNRLQKNLTPQRAFYLENNTAQIIPLQIPGVMNPNLKPFSRSGVDLKNGQKIFLSLRNKKVLILTVTDTIVHGTRIDVASLINKALNEIEN